MYPSKTLTKIYNPIDCLNRGLSLQEIENEIKKSLKVKLSHFPDKPFGREDNRWYYLAPLLLDDSEYVWSWLNHEDDQTYMKKVLSKAEEIEIVGIIKPSSNGLGSGQSYGLVLYKHELMEHLIKKINESEIAKEQLANPNHNVLTGTSFDVTSFDMSSLTDEQMADFYSNSNYLELYAQYASENGIKIEKIDDIPTFTEAQNDENLWAFLQDKLETGDYSIFNHNSVDVHSHNKMNKDNAESERGKMMFENTGSTYHDVAVAIATKAIDEAM
jgi:hypothetical protein